MVHQVVHDPFGRRAVSSQQVARPLRIRLHPGRMPMRPEEYRWSSCPGYVDARQAVEWVTYARVLGEFGGKHQRPRRAYADFVRAGLAEPPVSPFAEAIGGLLVGSQAFVERIRHRLGDRRETEGVPQLKRLRSKLPLDRILAEVARHFGCELECWSSGRRSDDAGRAMAAYLARRRFGYSATEVAERLGYRGPSSVSHAVERIEKGADSLRSAAIRLEAKLT